MAPFQRTWISWFRSLGQLLAIAEQSPLGPLTCLPHQSHTSFLLSRHGIWAQMPGLSFINLRLTKWISYLPSTLLSSLLSTLLSSFSSFLPFFFFLTIHMLIDRKLLLLLSRFSHVRLCATPWMAAHQAPPSLGFSRQEYWSGLPFPSPMREKWKWSRLVVSDS